MEEGNVESNKHRKRRRHICDNDAEKTNSKILVSMRILLDSSGYFIVKACLEQTRVAQLVACRLSVLVQTPPGADYLEVKI